MFAHNGREYLIGCGNQFMLKVITLNEKSLREKSEQLGRMIENSGWMPDLIIGIKTGGAYVAQYIKQMDYFVDCNYNEVVLQRKGTKVKKRLMFDKLSRLMPYLLLDVLRIYEIYISEVFQKKEQFYISNRKIELSEELKKQILKSRRVLLIDDAIDSGKTMIDVKQNILNVNNSLDVRTAVLTVTQLNPYISPDYSLYKRVLIRFPWSKDFKGLRKSE